MRSSRLVVLILVPLAYLLITYRLQLHHLLESSISAKQPDPVRKIDAKTVEAALTGSTHKPSQQNEVVTPSLPSPSPSSVPSTSPSPSPSPSPLAKVEAAAKTQSGPALSAKDTVPRVNPRLVPGVTTLQSDDPAAHCLLAKGSWCGSYWTQPLQPTKPPPRGSKSCPKDCSGLGWCDHDTGRCFCEAGWQGPDCTTPKKRPCYKMGPNKRDLNYTNNEWGWLHSRCAGVCDDDISMCYCPPETKFGHRVAPAGSPPGTPPLQLGRPMYWCQPSTTADNVSVTWTWNTHKYEDVLGPKGWCNSEQPLKTCACMIDGRLGQMCDHVVEQVCMNQCSGHGTCNLGFCKCHAGWYGHDCSRRKAGLPDQPGDHVTSKPSLAPTVAEVPAAQDPPKHAARRRPYVYVYDLDPAFNAHMMQYRIERALCTYRLFTFDNRTEFVGYYAYAVETAFHEMMLGSEHRTYDPEEADYFYVPIHVSCLADVIGKSGKPIWPEDVYGEGAWGYRPYHASMMLRAAQRWIAEQHPWWNRTGGTDHIWMLSHDEAPCYAPQEIWNSVILSHWGRLDFPHGSNTSYGADNYSRDVQHHSLPGGWLKHSSRAHACYDPEKHLVVPVFKQPPHYMRSPYLGGAQPVRDIFAFFRGDMGLNREGCIYSRCIRQTLWKLSQEHNWKARYNFWYGEHKDTPGDYGQLLTRTRFCLVIPGDGWSARYEDCMLHGAIPVIIMDNTLGPFESLIDYSQFTIRVPEHDLPRLMDILSAVPPERVQQLLAANNKAWMRFRWAHNRLTRHSVHDVVAHNTQNGATANNSLPGLAWAQTSDDDAFSTVIQWLHHRIPHTRGLKAGKQAAAAAAA